MYWQEVQVLSKKLTKASDAKRYDTICIELKMPYSTWKKLKHIIEAPSYCEPNDKKIKKRKIK